MDNRCARLELGKVMSEENKGHDAVPSAFQRVIRESFRPTPRPRIIQIATSGVESNAQTQCNWVTTALCDDGSVWYISDRNECWFPLPKIPVVEGPAEDPQED